MRTAFHSLGIAAWLFALSSVAAVAIAADRVYPDAEAVEPLAVGSAVPSVEVGTVEGEKVDLAEVVRSSGALLVFYRGGW